MKKRGLSVFLAVMMLAGTMAVGASAATVTDSGTCGDNLTWVYTSDGTLTISGTGEMDDWDDNDETPWDDYAGDVTEVVLRDGLTSIGDYAFSSCMMLEEISIPEGVTRIGREAFCACYSLSSVELPETLTEIGYRAFIGCALRSVEIPDSVTSLGAGAFYTCTWMESVTLPEGLTEIPDDLFGACWSLTSITIPESVTSIGDGAFYCCEGLTSIRIPESVTSIGGKAFSGCLNLTEIYFLGDCPDFAQNVFWGDRSTSNRYDTPSSYIKYVTATAYYPEGNSTWASSKLQDYGGDITWVACSAAYMAFTDLDTPDESNWYYDGVTYVLESGLMNGTGSTTFEPGTATTRSMIVTILYRLAGEPEVEGTSSFSDVVSGSWYEDAVIWAEQNDIAEGYGNGKFGVSDEVSREQIATFLYRYAEHEGMDVSSSEDLSDYPDAGEVSSWAETELGWAVAEGLVNGQGVGDETYLAPGDDAMRSETAVILMRFSA